MASSGIYKLDNGKPYLNNCFPAKNLLRMPEQGQVTSQIGTFALPQLQFYNVSHPFLFLQPPVYCSLPHPIPPVPVHLPPAALGSLLKHTSNHCVPFCSVTSHCWLFSLLFYLQSLTSSYLLYNPIPLFMPYSIVLSFHIAFICPESSSPHSSYPDSSYPTKPSSPPTSSTCLATLASVPIPSCEMSSSLCLLFDD